MPGHGTFGVRVNKTCKSFILLYSFHNHPRRLTLGNYPDLSLAEARAKAAQAVELLKQGVDPGQKKIVELVEYRTSPTFEEAVVSYLEWAEKNKKSWREDELNHQDNKLRTPNRIHHGAHGDHGGEQKTTNLSVASVNSVVNSCISSGALS